MGFLIWISNHCIGFLAISIFLYCTWFVSGIFRRYGHIHFIATFWIFTKAVMHGRWFGPPTHMVSTLDGLWVIFGIGCLIYYLLQIRKNHLRRMELCDKIDEGLLNNDMPAVAAYHAHLRFHLSGYKQVKKHGIYI